MPNAFVQQKAEQSTTSVTSFTTSAMTGTAGNALAVCTAVWNSFSVTASTTDSDGDTFVPAVNLLDGNFNLIQWELATNIAGGSITITVTPSASAFVSVCAQEYSGVALAPVEAVSSGFQSGQLVDPPPLSPPSLGDLYLSAWMHSGTGSETFTPAAGWTLRSNMTNTNNVPLGSEELIGSFAQTGQATLSGAASPNWNCACMVLRATDVTPPDDGDSPNYVMNEFPMTDRGFGSAG